jgi:hypothetical protein
MAEQEAAAYILAAVAEVESFTLALTQHLLAPLQSMQVQLAVLELLLDLLAFTRTFRKN